MKICSISATNFRGLKSIVLSKASDLNIIAGPNATGKSTLLEAIRLTKILLAQRANGEGQQALVQLGALSPHNQAIGGTGLDIASLANNPDNPILLNINLVLADSEITKLKNAVGQLALLLLQTDLLNSGTESPLAFTQFLSTAKGQKQLSEKTAEASTKLSSITPGTILALNLTMDPIQQTIKGNDNLAQSIVTLLDRGLPNHKTLFSMFPADRAFPQGEQPIQIGSGDAQHQLLSHLAQPGNKYSRLKQTIIHSVLLGQHGGADILEREFNLIFDNLLPGKKFHSVSFNDLGLLKVLVRDEKKNKTFDIDHMSSGEKGLVLTFLFLRLSLEKGGIVLLDEPELHLNSAVQEKILPFIIEHCVKPLSLQAFICTHSPEIVRDAYENDQCGLFHLRSEDDLTPILKQDQQELFEVFSRLGNSTSDVLFTAGNIYVEGPDDDKIIQTGFAPLTTGYKITALGGRGEIEREVPMLQKQETADRLSKLQLFILDNDRKATKLKSSKLVRVHQLKRYCMENYLLNEDYIYDLISKHAERDVGSRGLFPKTLEELALSQTSALAMREVYMTMQPDFLGMQNDDIEGKDIGEVAKSMAARLGKISGHLQNFDEKVWIAKYIEAYEKRRAEIITEWSTSWKTVCSGKQLIDDLYIKYQISMKKIEFKKEIMRRMASEQTDDWRILNSILTTELSL